MNCIRFLPFWSASLLLSACVTPTATVQSMRPATSQEASKLKTIAVLPFTGTEGDAVSNALQAALVEVKVDGSPYFVVKSQSDISGVLKDLKISKIEQADTQALINIGKRLGVEGVYTGSVQYLAVKDDKYKERQNVCTRYDSPTKLIQRCLATEVKDVECVRTTANATLVPKLVNVSSGRIVYSQQQGRSAIDQNCDGGALKRNSDELKGAALQEAVTAIRRDVAPWKEEVALPVKFESAAKLSIASAERFEIGARFAKVGEMERACRDWRQVESIESEDLWLNFNLAVCEVISNDLTSAQKRLKEKVEERLTAPDKDVRKLRDHISVRLAETASLTTQLTVGTASDPLTTAEIVELQRLLNQYGLNVGGADGQVGPRTREAVTKFQAQSGLPADGAPSREVLTKLRQGPPKTS